nr:MAK10-like protein [Tanacetum cinerariifolium]
MRIDPVKTQKEPTYQVVLYALALTTYYLAFLITADVPDIYMHQFWFTINKKDSTLYKFKIDKKSYIIDMEVFREIFQISPRLLNQDFDELPSDEEIVSFIKELGHKGDIKSITEDLHRDGVRDPAMTSERGRLEEYLESPTWEFTKPVKVISLPQDVPSTSDHRLIELENQLQCLMEAHLALMQPTQVNKITSSCEICSGPHDTQYYMGNLEQSFVEYVSSCTDEAGGDDNDIIFIEIIKQDDDSHIEEPEVDENAGTRESEENPFVEISNMTHDPPEGGLRFTNRTNKVAYKMPHKIKQYNSLSNLEKEHTKSVYLRNEEDMRRGVKYMMSKILWFHKECLELRPEYMTGVDDEGEVT